MLYLRITSARAAGLVRMHGHSNANAWQCSRGPPNAAGFSRRGISAGQAALAVKVAQGIAAGELDPTAERVDPTGGRKGYELDRMLKMMQGKKE